MCESPRSPLWVRCHFKVRRQNEFDPDDIYTWFMEIFVDSYDWVMVPNVYAMSQHADGGQITTKPYFSGSSYIRKMSNYSKGEWATIWDGLYWRWIWEHADALAKNPCWSMSRSLTEILPRDCWHSIGCFPHPCSLAHRINRPRSWGVLLQHQSCSHRDGAGQKCRGYRPVRPVVESRATCIEATPTHRSLISSEMSLYAGPMAEFPSQNIHRPRVCRARNRFRTFS